MKYLLIEVKRLEMCILYGFGMDGEEKKYMFENKIKRKTKVFDLKFLMKVSSTESV